MPLPPFPVDVHGYKRCPKCEGYVVPMAHPHNIEGLYCRNCGSDWFYDQDLGKEYGSKKERLPKTGKDTFTTSDFERRHPPS